MSTPPSPGAPMNPFSQGFRPPRSTINPNQQRPRTPPNDQFRFIDPRASGLFQRRVAQPAPAAAAPAPAAANKGKNNKNNQEAKSGKKLSRVRRKRSMLHKRRKKKVSRKKKKGKK